MAGQQRVGEALALHARDTDPHSFQWLVVDDHDHSVLAFARYGHSVQDTLVVIANLTPVVRHAHRIGLPHGGTWRERLNTDSVHYGGSNIGNHGHVIADEHPAHGQAWSATFTLPPLSVLWLEKQ